MGKYFVTITNQQTHFRLCRDDISRVFSHKIRKLPQVPAFNKVTRIKEDDATTINEDSEPQFEPIQFFASRSSSENWSEPLLQGLLYNGPLQ